MLILLVTTKMIHNVFRKFFLEMFLGNFSDCPFDKLLPAPLTKEIEGRFQ